MQTQSKQIVYVLVAAMLLTAVLAYFNRPKPPRLELVSPRQELAEYTDFYPGNTSLADRITKSYGLAMVLTQSQYTDRNVIALEAVRSWARQKFQREPDFLHPVAIEVPPEPGQTVVGAVGYNLFAAVRYWLEESVGAFLASRIEDFHTTRAYTSFRNAYFDIFGVDADSAALLAYYQTEKAKLAIGVVLWSGLWLAFAGVAVVSLLRSRNRFDKLQELLSTGWLLLALIYLTLAWMQNEVAMLISSVVCAVFGLYLRFPFTVEHADGLPRLKLLSLGTNWIALTSWLSLTMAAIQILTWIRTGVPNNPDPITLLFSSATGNFLQDPAHAKRYVIQIVGVIWLMVSAWTATQLKGDARAARETEESLASLKGPL